MEELKFAGVSDAELERRWALVRGLLEERGVGALLVLCSDDDMGGYVRWLTDNAVLPYRRGVLFHADDLMTVVEHGGMGMHRAPAGEDRTNRGVGEIHGVAEFPAVDYSLGYEAKVMVEAIRRRGYRRIGLAGAGNMPHRFVQRLTDGLGDAVELIDLTEAMDWFMVIKSAEEIGHIRKAAALQDRLMRLAVETARPGLTDAALTATLRAEAQRHGAEGGIILAGSGPQGSFAPFRPISRQNRTMQAGDYISLLVENSAPGGYFTEIARNIVLGRAQGVVTEAAEAATAMQAKIVRSFVPGTSCAEIFTRHNEDRAGYGLPPEDRIFAHGQGYNLVERPLIRQDEPMSVKAGMNFAIHPTIADGRTRFSVMCDNFLVGESGIVERFHKTEQKVFEV